MPKGKQPVADRLLLQAALEGLELQKQRIEEQIAHVQSRLGGAQPRRAPAAAAVKVAVVRKRRELSAAARRRIAAAQKKRWAEYRKAQKTA